jgi:hypothetical protein
MGLAWLITVGSRFDDWIYWTSLLHLHLIATFHTLDSFLITNLSIYFFWFSDWSFVFYYSVRFTASRLQLTQSESETCVTTDSQSVSLSWNEAPIWGLRRFLLLSDSCGFVDVGRSLWREDRFVVFSCYWSSPAQSFLGFEFRYTSAIFHCLIYETSFSSPPTTRRATVEVFDRASTRYWLDLLCRVAYAAYPRICLNT